VTSLPARKFLLHFQLFTLNTLLLKVQRKKRMCRTSLRHPLWHGSRCSCTMPYYNDSFNIWSQRTTHKTIAPLSAPWIHYTFESRPLDGAVDEWFMLAVM
jgi:hypothetical protein